MTAALCAGMIGGDTFSDEQGNCVGSGYGEMYGNRDRSAVNVTRSKAAVKTAPTAKSLAYNGQAQELVIAGTVAGGTMQYA